MIEPSQLIMAALGLPLLAALATHILGKMPDARDVMTLVFASLLAFTCWQIYQNVSAGGSPEWIIGEPLPGLELGFRLEPLGALFAAMAAGLWAINSVFAIGYMRGANEREQTRFYICFGIALFGAMGVAMAANFFTLFIFYEILTLSTYPLVAHKGDAAAKKGGRIYLITLVGASICLLLPGLIGVFAFSGTTDFIPGGVLAGKVDPITASVLLVLIVFGTGKAALMPIHFWLPRAMVAPTPVSALLHAVAVVKAGVFTLLKVSAFTFGPEVMQSAPATQYLLWLAAFSVVAASLVALRKDELKARLAWSTVGQLAYITSAALLASGTAIAGGGVHMLTHAYGKITLFMCAGAIYVATGYKYVSQLRGLGRQMPILFLALLAAALSVTGLPPFGGMWSKYMLITSAFELGQHVTAWALIASSLLSAAYLVPIAIIALMPPAGAPYQPAEIRAEPMVRLAVTALTVTAIGSFLLFFLADPVAARLSAIGLPAGGVE